MSDVRVIGGRVYLIPPKGILARLADVVEAKFNGGEFRFIDDSFEIPSTTFPFQFELVVDDMCEICPTAIEVMGELAARHSNVKVKVFNITYVKPPFEVSATPTFRINNKVKFTGIPLSPDGIRKYLSEFMKEAYVVSHPKTSWLIERIKRFAEAHGYRRNPNDVAYLNLIYRLLKNIDIYGYPFCPCRPLRKVEGATPEQIYELNKDKVCPCVYASMEVRSRGTCLCGLLWSKERVDKYIEERLRKYGWVIREIEWIQKALEELKKRVVTGRGKIVIESIVSKLQEIYAFID